MGKPSQRVLDVLGTLARLGLAATWLVSGGAKAAHPEQAFGAVQGFQVLPAGMVGPVANVLPYAELAFGLLLLVGLGTRLVAVFSGLLLLAFIAGIAQAWARGLTIDCGCFGGGGQVAADQTSYPQDLARDTGFFLLALWLIIRPRTALSLDGFLTGNRQGEPDDQSHELESA